MKLIPQNVTMVFLPGGGLGHNFGVGPPQIKSFDVFYETPVAAGQQDILLKWSPYPEADVVRYDVFRSFIGFVAPVPTPGDLAGLTLQLKLDGGAVQTLAFNGTQDIITAINTFIVGGRAYASVTDPTAFLFRSNTGEDPGSVEIVGGTALPLLGLLARVITEQSEHYLLGAVDAPVDPLSVVDFTDPDGTVLDFYALSTLDHLLNNSLRTAFKQATTDTGDLCVLSGIVTDLRGVRVPDVQITATLVAFPYSPVTPSHITLEPVTALSNPDGKYSLVALQGATIRLEIPAIGLSREFVVPAQAFAAVADLFADDNAKLSTDANLGVM